MAVLLPRHCAVCGSGNQLLRCAGCQIVYYCGSKHQTLDWKAHKHACSRVKKAQKKYTEEESKLRDADEFGWGWTWDKAVGRFWGVLETRDYMRARFDYVNAMLAHNTIDGVERAVDHHLDLMRLCRSDNMGIRDITPHLFLRLGRDQAMYDFCKWWSTTGNESDYDWGDTELPHLNLRGEDALESADKFAVRFGSLSLKIAITLLKIRLLMDLRDVRNADLALSGAKVLPKEILDMIKRRMVRTDVVAARDGLITDTSGAVPVIRALKQQIRKMFTSTAQSNEYIWSYLFHPDGSEQEPMQSYYTMRSPEEAQLTLNYCYLAWQENPGAVDVAKRAGGHP